MAKRFTDTDLWDKEWFMNLPPKLKCLVKYVRDKCDIAGFWSPNWRLASMHIGEEVTENDLLSIDYGQQFEKTPDGKISCIGFINFQYGETLSEKSPVHRKVQAILDKNKIDYTHPQNRVLNTLQDKEEEEEEVKEEEKAKEEEKEKRQKIELVFPYNSPEFMQMWGVLVKEPFWKKKSKTALQAVLKKLSNYPERDAIQMMEEAIAGAWKNVYELKTQNNGNRNTGKTEYGTPERAAEYERLFAQRYGGGGSTVG